MIAKLMDFCLLFHLERRMVGEKKFVKNSAKKLEKSESAT